MKEYQPKIDWTPEQDKIIIAARSTNPPMFYDELCAKLGYSRWTVVTRAYQLGFVKTRNGLVPRQAAIPDPGSRINGETLPAGHPLSWGAISQGQPWPGRIAG